MTKPVYFFSGSNTFFRTFLFLTGCIFIIFQTSAQQITNGNKPKPLGAISATITTTDVSYEAAGVSTDMFLNLIYVINYNGSIHLTISGGTPPYTVTSPGINNVQSYLNDAYLTNLGPGTYTINITDANGQTFSIPALVGTKYPQPSASLSNIIFPSNCSNADGGFTINASGGTPPYTYSIDGGNTFSTNNTFTGLTQGVYPVLLVKDANGFLGGTGFNPSQGSGNYFSCNTDGCCTSNFYVYAAQPITCSNNSGSIEAFYGTGSSSLQFSIDGVNYFTPTPEVVNGVSEFQYTFKNLAPGMYHIYAKYNTGEIGQQSISIIKGCGVTLSPVTTNASCQQNNGSINAVASDGAPPYSYSIDGVNFQSNNIFNNLSTGLYYLWVKDANGLTGSAFATLFDQCPKVTATETDEKCNQKNGIITASGYNGTAPYQFSIDGINFQASTIFNNLSAGNYTVTIKDAGNFTTTYPVTVNNNCLQLAFSVINTTCSNNNGSITATASGGTAPYQYSVDGINFQTNNVFNNLIAGNYSVTVKDANNVTSTTSTTIADAGAPKINVALTQASCSNTNGSINITATGGTSPLQFSINNGATFQSNNIFNNLDSAQYIALIKDANGCSVSDTVQLTAPPTPVVFIGNDTTLCTNETLLLSAPQVAGYQYLWQDNSTANIFKVSSAGTYTLKVINQFNCSASASVDVNFMPVPNFNLGPDTSLCNGQTILLQPTVVLLQASYLWNTGATSFSIHTNIAGTYWLQVSNGGCAKRDSIIISSKPNPIINLGNDTSLCEGQILVLNATNNNTTYIWQDGSTEPTFTVNNTGIYSVNVVANGCDTTGKISVEYITKPIINLGNDTSICITESLLLNASYPQSTYVWQDGSTQPQFNVTKAGTYSADVTNACGDTKDSINIVYENCSCRFYVPSAFSPNTDGKNDIFIPKYQCAFSNYELKIFNRWGQLVFNSNNAANGWDGNFNNHQQPTGSYVWELNYKDNLTGKLMHKNGTLVLVR